jgi:hypothetical protein
MGRCVLDHSMISMVWEGSPRPISMLPRQCSACGSRVSYAPRVVFIRKATEEDNRGKDRKSDFIVAIYEGEREITGAVESAEVLAEILGLPPSSIDKVEEKEQSDG